MKIKTVRLDDKTRDVLMRSRIEGNNLFLPGQLPREDYVRVAKAIEAAGGKWNRKAGCHVFPSDVRETLNISTETVEVVNIQQTFQAFNTPPHIARQVVGLADIWCVHRVLEPSAGTGALLELITGKTAKDPVAVEINSKLAESLKNRWPGVEIINKDFLTCNGDLGQFDRIVMNPPFERGSDIMHIKHAMNFLKPMGRLVAICANGPRQRESLEPICSQWIDLPEGSFSEQGTNVNTAIVVIEP